VALPGTLARSASGASGDRCKIIFILPVRRIPHPQPSSTPKVTRKGHLPGTEVANITLFTKNGSFFGSNPENYAHLWIRGSRNKITEVDIKWKLQLLTHVINSLAKSHCRTEVFYNRGVTNKPTLLR